MTFELFISRRYFKANPRQTIIALISMLGIIGVTIGVTALIVVIAVMGGFESDLKSRILGIEPHLVIEQTNDRPLTNYDELIRRANQTKGVLAAWPLISFQAMLRANSRISGALIKGVDPDMAKKGLHIKNLQSLKTDKTNFVQGRSISPIVLGKDLARILSLEKGDTLFVVSPRGALAPMGFVPYMRRFLVTGFFETGMYEYDSYLAFVTLQDARALSRMKKNAAAAVEIRVKDIFQTAHIGKSILSGLSASQFRMKDWKALNRNLFSALKLEKTAMFITLTLIILVATFSITSAQIMMVLEKTRDIAVLMTLGTTVNRIKRIFMMQGLFIGITGTTGGVIFGTGICLLQIHYKLIRLPGDVFYITALPVHLQFTDVILVAFSTLLICFAATLYPAHKAAHLNPVEAIRYG
ncbi:MAG: lipoprotein-releasing ABC transporter permease subunit [Desulfobacteraceae bacterium]|nr:lipoprotein-releasing ABC transporter permease subunit [Desulfobacteraceae bacterium]